MSGFGDGVWSNNEQVVFIAHGVDNNVRFYLNIAEEGDYDLSAAFTKAGDFGIYQHYIDGKPVGKIFDTTIQPDENGLWHIELPSGLDIGIKFCPYCGCRLEDEKR